MFMLSFGFLIQCAKAPCDSLNHGLRWRGGFPVPGCKSSRARSLLCISKASHAGTHHSLPRYKYGSCWHYYLEILHIGIQIMAIVDFDSVVQEIRPGDILAINSLCWFIVVLI